MAAASGTAKRRAGGPVNAGESSALSGAASGGRITAGPPSVGILGCVCNSPGYRRGGPMKSAAVELSGREMPGQDDAPVDSGVAAEAVGGLRRGPVLAHG